VRPTHNFGFVTTKDIEFAKQDIETGNRKEDIEIGHEDRTLKQDMGKPCLALPTDLSPEMIIAV